jgi:hypothetical protein
LKADFDISGFSARVQVILRTLKKYGLIVADNGSNWFIQGTHDDRWDDDEIGELKSIEGNHFEAVDISPWMNSPQFEPNSAAVPDDVIVSLESSVGISNNAIPFVIFPNPVLSYCFIRYTLPEAMHVKLQVCDITGKTISTLVNRFQHKGSCTVNFNAEKLSNGIYYCNLELPDRQTITCRIVKF